MRPPADYVALRDIQIPDSYAFAARAGDDMTEVQRANRGLTVGLDVRPLRTDSMPRPADDADRKAWQDYAVVRGVPYAEAVNLDRADLLKRVDGMDDGDGGGESDLTAMPDQADLKARWHEYARLEVLREVGGTVPEETVQARLAELTKAELMALFGPEANTDDRASFMDTLR